MRLTQAAPNKGFRLGLPVGTHRAGDQSDQPTQTTQNDGSTRQHGRPDWLRDADTDTKQLDRSAARPPELREDFRACAAT
jgi:hypothetical protein